MNNIKEGEDIYLECLVDSRPEVSKLYYTHEVSLIENKQERRYRTGRFILLTVLRRNDS